MKEQVKGQATAEQIAMWKNLHGDIFEARVDESIAYLRKPDRATIKAMAAVAQSDPIRASEVLLENCWLGGDETIKTDNGKFLAVSATLSQLVEVKTAELKKL
jgi:hypothetical protein